MNTAKTAKDDLAPEMEALKAKLKATWMAGDFDRIAQSVTTRLKTHEFGQRRPA